MDTTNHDNSREDEMEKMKIPWKNSLIVLFLILGFVLLLLAINCCGAIEWVKTKI